MTELISTDSLEQPTAAGQQGDLIELTITNLNHNGEGVGRHQGRVVFVPDVVPGDRLSVRLLRVKPHYAQGMLHEILEASPHRVRPSCIVADKCGGCQWQQIDYETQLEAKRDLVIQDLERIGGFVEPPVDAVLADGTALAYRNKATYPLRRSQQGTVQAGYYQKGSHRLVNLNQCPIQDQRLNPFLAQIKQDIQQRHWSIYDEQHHRGRLRHLSLRIGQRTGEVLLTLVSSTPTLEGLEEQAQTWMEQYPELVGVCLNLNAERGNQIFGRETRCIAGRPYLREIFADLEFRIQSTTFFQVNTRQAEALLQVIQTELALQGHEIMVDAYCGIGTMTLPLAKRVQQMIGIEVQQDAVEQAQQNAELNAIQNASFQIGKTEVLLPQLTLQPDVVLLDPPRKGCEATVIQTLLQQRPQRIVYVSCNASTLARDLKLLSPAYRLNRVQPADFFPQTAHVESAAFLTRLD
jgi:23S rRNA (uracil1939-C5)-methyltransferase